MKRPPTRRAGGPITGNPGGPITLAKIRSHWSHPHGRRHHHSPNRTSQELVRKIVHLRWRHRLSPLAIASRLSMSASTVHAVLVRCRLNRLSHIDIRTGEPIRRYEHDHPGALIHVDVKKLGNIPTGGGWRFVGRSQGQKNRHLMSGTKRSRYHQPLLGHAYVHTVVDDHSRVAYAEIHDDETADTAVAVLRRAVGWFSDRGVIVEAVLSDNGGCYRSHAWKQACADLGVKHRRTRPYRPQTNGKIEGDFRQWMQQRVVLAGLRVARRGLQRVSSSRGFCGVGC
ncbi:hypothetical protein MAGR_10950 [Mycolicibacterium agri]|uniref:Integrase catalytic domain-containing protein n=1 Tax=Mycolicibacterium agri TaxID=36811 RepID=A0A7I9VW70_MYCAG|nr:hypothetical protein MAGR_10950 [Mycolicibacterium agri]